MRIIIKKRKYPEEGSIRVKTRFLLFPKKINNEVRWLEKTSWKEKYIDVWIFDGYYHGWKVLEWIN